MKELIVAQSAGFCFGVNRSVGMAEKLLEDKGKCASLGQLIHNEDVVRELTSKGLRVIEDPSDANFGEDVKVTANGSTDASTMMGKIIGILLTITRFVGVALVVYGVYEVVMSFMQNQPEAKTKGIIMALAGIVMTALKSILVAIKIVQ